MNKTTLFVTLKSVAKYLVAYTLVCAIDIGLSVDAYAASCGTAGFPTPIANSKNTGSLALNDYAELSSVPNRTLTTTTLTQSANALTVCDNQSCSKSNTVSQVLTRPTFVAGTAVAVYDSGTYNYTPGNYGSFLSNGSATLNFAPGVYMFNGNFTIGWSGRLNVSSAGTVQIYVNGTTYFHGSTTINSVAPAADKNLFFYSVGDMTFSTSMQARMLAYSEANMTLNGQVNIVGALSAAGAISTAYQSYVTYDSAMVSATDNGNTCAAALHHFNFTTATTGNTCLAHSVTITAADASNNTITDYTGTINLSTSTNNGNWYTTGTTADAYGTLTRSGSDSGLATYTFVSNDAGTAKIEIVNGHSETLSMTVLDSVNSITSSSDNITFRENVFVVTSTDTLGTDVIAGREHQFKIQMIKKDPVSGSCGASPSYSQSSIKMWLSRAASDPNGTAPQAKNAANTHTVSLPNSAPGSNNFTANISGGSANFSLLTSDVGRYDIMVSDTSNSFSDVAIVGSSGNITVRPFGFAISATGNPAATTANGSSFKKAGENFTTTVTAKGWQQADDANNDGTPDNHADSDPSNNANLSDNTTLPSFGTESPAEGVTLTSSLLLPSGGRNPALTGTMSVTGFNAGSASTTLAFNEVGILTLRATPTDTDYLSAGAAPTAKMASHSGTIGRFYPAQFVYASSAITASCTVGVDYSYFGRALGTTVQLNAVDTNGSITENYQDDFAKLTSANLTSSFKVADLGLPTELTARSSVTNNSFLWNAGVLSANTSITVARAAAPDGPFTQASIGIAPIDSDGVALATNALDLDSDNNASNDSKSLGLTTLRHGRLRLNSAYGPETADLPVEFVTEYWDGSQWLTNVDDSCTTIALANISYPAGAISTDANRTVALGSGTTTGNYGNLGGGNVGFVAGDAGHYFSPPGSGNTGSVNVNIDITSYPWLQFDWNNDGDHNESTLPTANFRFGGSRGHDRILFWQEVLN
ncbi:MAG: DUF6701 domain-containing protein [Marinagarivorans sp.]|nr:DUF6701 domain-containing protein [Marinagarivorans sp.]